MTEEERQIDARRRALQAGGGGGVGRMYASTYDHASYKNHGTGTVLRGSGAVIASMHEWPAILGLLMLLGTLLLCVSLVIHHGETMAGTAGAVLCVAVGGLWLAGVARARRDVQDAEEAVRALDDDQRRLLGLRQMAGNAAGVAHGGSDEDDSEDEDYAFGIAAREGYGGGGAGTPGGILSPTPESMRKKIVVGDDTVGDAQSGALIGTSPFARARARARGVNPGGSAGKDAEKWSEYIARWNEHEDELTMRSFEMSLEQENAVDQGTPEAMGRMAMGHNDMSPFGHTTPDQGAAALGCPSPQDNQNHDDAKEDHQRRRSSSNSPSPLPAAPLSYRPSPKDRTVSRQHGSSEFWPSEEEEEEALRNLGVSARLWEEGPDRLREWMSDRMMKPLLSLCDHSHAALNASLLGMAPADEWERKFGLSLPMPPLGERDGGARAPSAVMAAVGEVFMGGPSGAGGGASDVDSVLLNIKTFLQQQIRQAAPHQQAALHAQRHALQCLNTHLHLMYLLRGEFPSHLMAPIPPSYCYERIREMSVGTFCSAFTWNSGSAWGSRVHIWADALPSDTHLVMYLFLAYIDSYSWTFPIDPVSGVDVPYGLQGSLFAGELPLATRAASDGGSGRGAGRGPFTAVLPARPRETIENAFMLVVEPSVHPPQITVIEEDKQLLSLSGHYAAFRAILLVIVRSRNVHGGQLGLEMNVDAPIVSLSPVLAL